MKKAAAIILIVLLCFQNLGAVKLDDYEPYMPGEFPTALEKLRRSEILFFGSLALTFPMTVLSYNIATQLGAPELEEPIWVQMGVAAGLSLSVAFIDWIIGEVNGE